MDPRFSVRHSSMVDHGMQAYAQGTPTLYPSYITSFQAYHTGFEQPILNTGEHVTPSSFPSAGRSFLVTDPLPQATAVYQRLPAPALNNSYQLINVSPPVSETAPSGLRSVYAPTYADVSGLGRGYGSSSPAYAYQPYSQAQVRLGSTLLPPEPLGISSGRPLLLEKEHDVGYSRAGLLSRRREAEQRTKLERQRVLDHKRDLKPRSNIDALKSPLVRQSGFHNKQQIQKVNKQQIQKIRGDSKNAVPKKFKGERIQGSRITGSTWCSICQVECSSAQVLQDHIGGKKHKAQLEAKKPNTQGVKKELEVVVKEAVKKNSKVEKGTKDSTAEGELKQNATKVETKDKAAQLAKTEKNKRKRARRAERRKALLTQKPVRKVEEVDGTVNDAVSKALQEIQKVGDDFTVQVKQVEVGAVEMIFAAQGEVGTEGVLIEGKNVEKRSEVDADEMIVATQGEVGIEGVLAGGKDERKQSVEETPAELKQDVDMVEQYIDGEGTADKSDVKKEEGMDKGSTEVNLTSDGPTIESGETKSEAKGKKGKAGALAQSETVRCEVCAVTCRNATVYESHLKGEKHAERLKRSLEGTKGKPAKGKKVGSN